MLDVENQIFHRDRIDLLLLHLSHHIWTNGPSKVIQYNPLTSFTTTFLARVTQKKEMKPWNNGKASGKLFNFTVIDESCDLRVTAFDEDADKYVISNIYGCFLRKFKFCSGLNQWSKWESVSRFPMVSWKTKILNTITLVLIMRLLWDAQVLSNHVMVMMRK